MSLYLQKGVSSMMHTAVPATPIHNLITSQGRDPRRYCWDLLVSWRPRRETWAVSIPNIGPSHVHYSMEYLHILQFLVRFPYWTFYKGPSPHPPWHWAHSYGGVTMFLSVNHWPSLILPDYDKKGTVSFLTVIRDPIRDDMSGIYIIWSEMAGLVRGYVVRHFSHFWDYLSLNLPRYEGWSRLQL